MDSPDLATRARRHAALGDPARLAIVDELRDADRAPVELAGRLDIAGNLLAHHLDVLAEAGLVTRNRSSGDGRRRYVHLERDSLDELWRQPPRAPEPVLFVCTANSARSQLAAVVWESMVDAPAASAGTHPAERIHAGATAAARRAGLRLDDRAPTALDDVADPPPLVITVCDRAHEELGSPDGWLHWSVPDPVVAGTAAAFDDVVEEMRARIGAFAGARP